MEPEKISPTPAPAYAQHAPPGPETHQLAPMAPQNTYMQPQPVPEKYPQQYPQQQPLPQEYDKAGAGAGVAPGPVMAQQPNVYNTATPLHALQRGPTPVDCPVCGQREMTRVEPHSGNTTHGWAAVLCCCFCLGCLPYMMSSLKDVDHHCGKCGVMLATWHNSGRVEVHHAVRT